MKTFFKKTAAVFAAVLLLAAILLPVSASAESLHIKKVVSVVYDDSGSMRSGGSKNWAYASYAMQTFCGLLNADDRLFVTYMSGVANKGKNYSPEELDLSESGIQSSINKIKAHSAYDTTPYLSLEIAMNKLSSVADTDENTQYWLFIITDGVSFDEYGINSDRVDADLAAFANQKMANGTTPQITYLSIGKGAISASKNESAGIFSYQTEGAEDIINVMSDIADKISGRSRLTNADIKLIDSKTVQVTSEVPLMNIAVLSQKSTAHVSQATYANGDKLSIKRSVSFLYPSVSGNQTDTSLMGGGFLINDNSGTIDSGTYILKFDQNVTLENFVIMFEPAIEVRLNVTHKGKNIELHELDDLREGDKLNISYKIYEFGTDNEVPLDKLPDGTTCMITISENGAIVQKSEGSNMDISNYVLKQTPTEIRASVHISGFTPIEFKKEFTPQEYVYVPPSVYTIKTEFGSGTTSVPLDEIGGNHDLSLVFTFYKDYVRIDNKGEVEALNPQINVSPAGNDGTYEITDDGKLIFKPNKANVGSASAGDFHVTVTCEAESENGKFEASKMYSVKVPEYTIKAEFGSGTTDVHLDDITKNHDLSIVFTFYKDFVRIDNKAEVEALRPQISVLTAGNEGTYEITEDGRLIFKPNKTSGRTTGGGSYDVEVKCEAESISGKVSATKKYAIRVPEYTIKAEFGSDVTQIHLDDISKPHDLSIIFSFYKDGVLLENEADVMALRPYISVSPEGNSGEWEVTKGGKLVFKPNKAKGRTTGGGTFDVTVTCEAGGTQLSKTYKVQVPEYVAITLDAGTPIRKNEFFGNKIGVSFYIERDGVKLDKASLGEYTVLLNEEYSHLKLDVNVLDDGTVVCIPYDENERKLNPFTWLGNWAYYFGLEGTDVVISFDNEEGSATATIPVRGATFGYIMLNVVLSLLACIALLAFIIWWIYAVITKPRFADGAAIYYGSVAYEVKSNSYVITSWTRKALKKYNTLWYLIAPTKRPIVANISSGIKVSPDMLRKITYQGTTKRYINEIIAKSPNAVISSVADIAAYVSKNGKLAIEKFEISEDTLAQNKRISPTAETGCHVLAGDFRKIKGVNRMVSATVFCYTFVKKDTKKKK